RIESDRLAQQSDEGNESMASPPADPPEEQSADQRCARPGRPPDHVVVSTGERSKHDVPRGLGKQMAETECHAMKCSHCTKRRQGVAIQGPEPLTGHSRDESAFNSTGSSVETDSKPESSGSSKRMTAFPETASSGTRTGPWQRTPQQRSRSSDRA